MRRLVVALAFLAALGGPGLALASPANGELCAVQTWDEEIVISVHRAGFLPVSSAPRGQVDAAASACTNLAATEGFMPADKRYDDWVGQSNVCWIAVQPGLAYVIHAGKFGMYRATTMCSAAAEEDPAFVTWF